ncbi:MAG: VOC family protein [Ruminiclostridium sp.]|nr:VOC family protein [Ruminiclostridium sp.]
MKFCWCTIMVRDMEESIRFYRDIVGLSIVRELTVWPNIKIVFMGDGGDELELIHNPRLNAETMGNGLSIGFITESVEEMMQFVQSKGIEIESGPFQPNQFVTFFNVRDPNGLRVQFIEKNYPHGAEGMEPPSDNA